MTITEIVWSCFKCQEQYACDPSPLSRSLMDRMVSLHEAKCYGSFLTGHYKAPSTPEAERGR